jgi:hypothetical protein
MPGYRGTVRGRQKEEEISSDKIATEGQAK